MIVERNEDNSCHATLEDLRQRRFRRPGYVEVAAMCDLAPDSALWEHFIREVIHMPLWMLPAVQHAVRQKAWTRALDPIKSVTENAIRAVHRMGLRERDAAKGE